MKCKKIKRKKIYGWGGAFDGATSLAGLGATLGGPIGFGAGAIIGGIAGSIVEDKDAALKEEMLKKTIQSPKYTQNPYMPTFPYGGELTNTNESTTKYDNYIHKIKKFGNLANNGYEVQGIKKVGDKYVVSTPFGYDTYTEAEMQKKFPVGNKTQNRSDLSEATSLNSIVKQYKYGYGGRYDYGGVKQANSEVENNEVLKAPQGYQPTAVGRGDLEQTSSDTFKADGATHESGGIPTNMQDGTRIYSDRLKSLNGKTFAKEADRLSKSKARFEKVIANKDNTKTKIAEKTANLMIGKVDKKLDELFQEQEAVKAYSETPQYNVEFAEGGVYISEARKTPFKAALKQFGGDIKSFGQYVKGDSKNSFNKFPYGGTWYEDKSATPTTGYRYYIDENGKGYTTNDASKYTADPTTWGVLNDAGLAKIKADKGVLFDEYDNSLSDFDASKYTQKDYKTFGIDEPPKIDSLPSRKIPTSIYMNYTGMTPNVDFGTMWTKNDNKNNNPLNKIETPYTDAWGTGSTSKKMDFSNLAYNAAAYAPTIYNLGKGLFGKPAQQDPTRYMSSAYMKYSPVDMMQVNKELNSQHNIDRSNLNGTAGSYNTNMGALSNLYSKAKGTANIAAQTENMKNRATTDYYNYNIDAANKTILANVDAANQLNRDKRSEYIGTGLEGLSSIAQTNRLMQNTANMDNLQGSILETIAGYYGLTPEYLAYIKNANKGSKLTAPSNIFEDKTK